MTVKPELDPQSQDAIDKMEEFIGGLRDQIDDLRDENEILRRELALSSPRNVNTLMHTLVDYLDWNDSPNSTMEEKSVQMIRTQLRSALNDAIRELR